jgi:AcrR family transcriptional regulator
MNDRRVRNPAPFLTRRSFKGAMARPADPNAKQALIDAARAEFARRGLRGARVEDITAACGLSKGAFYLHYPSKESLFGELVAAFQAAMSDCSERRIALSNAFRNQHGHLTRRDIDTRSERWQRSLELEAEEDLRSLEVMWTYRDVLGVLLTGAQGTQFEGVVWQLVDRELARVVADVGELRSHKAVRSDIPPEVLATMLVGTYLLIGQRMSRLNEKPDLRAWAASLQKLIREGSAPTVASEARPGTTQAVAASPPALRKPGSRKTRARGKSRRPAARTSRRSTP